MTSSQIKRGMVLNNVQPGTGRVLAVVRVMESLDIGGESFFRVCDAHEARDDKWLISHSRTWAVPAANLQLGDELVSHASGLVCFAY